MSIPLDRDLVRQMIEGFAEANRFIDAELGAQLPLMTDEQALHEFDELYRTWKLLGDRQEGSWEEIEAERLHETVALREAFARIARARGQM